MDLFMFELVVGSSCITALLHILASRSEQKHTFTTGTLNFGKGSSKYKLTTQTTKQHLGFTFRAKTLLQQEVYDIRFW